MEQEKASGNWRSFPFSRRFDGGLKLGDIADPFPDVIEASTPFPLFEPFSEYRGGEGSVGLGRADDRRVTWR